QLTGEYLPFILPAPLVVPPLAERSADLDRIIAEYAGDAIAELAAPAASFTADDHAWVRDHAAASLAEIEAAALRVVALYTLQVEDVDRNEHRRNGGARWRTVAHVHRGRCPMNH